jgi:Ser/Thr protein kinase RdoA (MazF antagonist)
MQLSTSFDSADSILRAYALGVVRERRYLGGGMFADPLLVSTDSGRYVLRAHRFRNSESSFRFQAETLDLVVNRGIRCPRVVRDRFGRLGQIRDSILWALYEYLDGHKYTWAAWLQAKSDARFLTNIGEVIARLHEALAQVHPIGEANLSPSLPPIQFSGMHTILGQWETDLARIESGAVGAQAPQARAALVANSTRIREHWMYLFDAVRDSPLSKLNLQIVHGDVSPVNMIFNLDDGSFGLIDWDCVRYGPRIYDALGDVLNRLPVAMTEQGDFNVDEVRLYLNGYQRAASRPLSPIELDCIPALCMARQLEDLRQRVFVLADLVPEMDAEYAALIRGRVRALDSIKAREAQLLRLRGDLSR